MTSDNIPVQPIHDLGKLKEIRRDLQEGGLALFKLLHLAISASALALAIFYWNLYSDTKLMCGEPRFNSACKNPGALFSYLTYSYNNTLASGIALRGVTKEDKEHLLVARNVTYFPFLYFAVSMLLFLPVWYYSSLDNGSNKLNTYKDKEGSVNVLSELTDHLLSGQLTMASEQWTGLLLHVMSLAVILLLLYVTFPLPTHMYVADMIRFKFDGSTLVSVYDWTGIARSNNNVPPAAVYLPSAYNCKYLDVGASGSGQVHFPVCDFPSNGMNRYVLLYTWILLYVDAALLCFAILSHVLCTCLPCGRYLVVRPALNKHNSSDKELLYKFAKKFSYSQVMFIRQCAKSLSHKELRMLLQQALRKGSAVKKDTMHEHMA